MRWVLVLVAAIGCGKPSKKKQCDELAEMTIAFADALGKELGGGKKLSKDPEIKAKMAEFHAQCMTWPDEVFECMRDNDETSPKCVEAMSHVTGTVTSGADKAPQGPAVVATASVGEVDWDGLATSLAPDGTLTAASKEWIAAIDAGGKEVWRTELANEGWMVPLHDGSFLVASREHELVAFDGVTGARRWSHPIPQQPDDEYSDRSAEAAVRVGERAMVVIADGRFLRVDPAACTKKKGKCVELAFALPEESMSEPALLAIGDEIVVGENEALRRFSKDGQLLSSIAVRDDFGGMAVMNGTRIATTMDDELVLWDLAKCPGSALAVLPRKQGRMYIRGEGDCEDCISPPTGCLLARSELSDVDTHTPRVLRDGSILVTNMEGPARAAIDGKKHWVSEVDAIGPMREVGGTVVFLSRGDDGTKVKLVALDTATGKAKWQRALDVESRDISYSSDPVVEVAGPWLVAGAKGRLSWIKLSTPI